MRKLSLLVALALLITIGGVYATWNYSQGDVEAGQAFVRPVMDSHNVSGDKGTFTIDADDCQMIVKNAGSHTTSLDISGDIVITFTPSPGADETVANNGIRFKVTFTCTEDWKYDSQTIFTITNGVIDTNTATKSLTITEQELETMISMATFTLPSYSDFQDFQTVLNRGNIKIVVEEVK